jgi:hypothetical protein
MAAHLPLVAALGVLAIGGAAYAGYVKDDAFISLRYARNLLAGRGLTFNPAEPVEGYTNFLWVMLAVPALAMRLDPIVWLKAIGTASAAATVVLLHRGPRWPAGSGQEARVGQAAAIGALLYASSTSVALWSMSGLEGCLLAFVALAAFLLGHRGRAQGASPSVRDLAASSALYAVGALTRPEGHLLFAVAAVFEIAHAVRARRLDRGGLVFLGLAPAVLAPYHLFRWLTFGSLVPNTFLVKASSGPEAWSVGVQSVLSWLAFGAHGPMLALAIVAIVALPPPRAHRLHAGIVCGLFLLYLARVGRDEMKHFRLLLPSLPLLCLLAGEGLARAAELLREDLRRPALLVAALGLASIGVAYTLTHRRETTYLARSERSFQSLGRHLERQARPGDSCIFQDMGAAPWVAPSVRFVDSIGIVDPKIARLTARFRLSPFLRQARASLPGGERDLSRYDALVRDELLSRHTRWAAFVAYVPRRLRPRVATLFARARSDPERLEHVLAPYVAGNAHAHRLTEDPRFRARYTFRRAWKRDEGYYIGLYER